MKRSAERFYYNAHLCKNELRDCFPSIVCYKPLVNVQLPAFFSGASCTWERLVQRLFVCGLAHLVTTAMEERNEDCHRVHVRGTKSVTEKMAALPPHWEDGWV